MNDPDLAHFESLCESWLGKAAPADPAHDLAHVERVVKNCRRLTEAEGAKTWITIPAAWLHDCVAVAKDSTQRSRGSRLAADAATRFLAKNGFPESMIEDVGHAIEAHSFSAGVQPRSLEARVVQDADRLDSLGAIGIARCLLVGGKLDRALLHPDDPFCEKRPPDDGQYTLDHFYAKLLKLPDEMQTASGREMAAERARVMKRFLDDLREELGR